MATTILQDIRAVGQWLEHIGSPEACEPPLPPPVYQDRQNEFGRLFRAALRHIPGAWEDAGNYLSAMGPELPLGEFSCPYRVLIISGILSQCISPAVTAFADARTHLREAHGFEAEYLDVAALGSCGYNGRTVANYLREHAGDGGPKYILVGYSQGAPDIQEMLVQSPDIVSNVAALLTVSGCIGGSHLLDMLSGARFVIPAPSVCIRNWEVGDGGAVNSLRSGVRRKFLEEHPDSLVPSYSITAASTEATTSLILRPAWRALGERFGPQDSQMAVSDQIVPNGKLLAVAKGDHWAVAMPFESLGDAGVNALLDCNHFPRAALLEAALRYVAKDLGA